MVTRGPEKNKENKRITYGEHLIPCSVLEASLSSQLVLIKDLLETDTVSTASYTDETTVDPWGKLPKLM